MKAVLMTKAGDPEVLQLTEIEAPQITHPSQVKVQIKAAGINPIDTKVRANALFFPDKLPAVLGCDGAGVVVAVGDKVDKFKQGDEVWFCHGGLGDIQGNYAEFTVINQDELMLKPTNLSFIEAAASPLVLITAWEALYDKAGLHKNQTVLIHAGAGGVGHVAIQLAKLAGAKVCTTVSSEEKEKFVRNLGADHVINYKQTDVVDAVMQWTENKGVDVILDTVGGEVFIQSINALSYSGSLVTLLDPGTDVVWKHARLMNHSISFELMLTPMLKDLPKARKHQMFILDRCKEYFETGHLKIHISHTLSLSKSIDAHNGIQSGSMTGKIVLDMEGNK